jgi:hypothetical protein
LAASSAVRGSTREAPSCASPSALIRTYQRGCPCDSRSLVQ